MTCLSDTGVLAVLAGMVPGIVAGPRQLATAAATAGWLSITRP